MVLTKAEERVIARLNQQLGSGAEALHRSRDLVDEYSNRLQELRSKVSTRIIPDMNRIQYLQY